MERYRFTNRGFDLAYLDSAPGESGREAVLLLHGFPDTADMWLPEIEALHQAGLRCIAPDTLGCGASAMAPNAGDYNAKKIADDHAALLDHLGIEQAHVVGHDWGAILSWLLAGYRPQRVKTLTVFSVGHPMSYARAGVDQKAAGWYVGFFMLAGFSERLLLGRGRFALERLFGSHPDINGVVDRLREPGRLTAALRIYRASVIDMLFRPHPKSSAPTVGVWSRGDVFLVESQMANAGRYVTNSWRFDIVDGGHWIPIEQSEYVTEKILASCGGPSLHGSNSDNK